MPRPLVIRRLAEMAGNAGNGRLAEQLDGLLAIEHGEHISRARTGVGSEVVIPRLVSQARSISPWLARHEVTFRGFFDQIREELASHIEQPRFDRSRLVRQAEAAKTYDAYHSTTIEGYRITPEEVSAVIAGRQVGGHDPEDVKARMAVKGYSAAFDRCIAIINESDGSLDISEPLIQTLYQDLFSPSVEAGIIDADALRGWRSNPAYLRGARYVPPLPEKVPQLMQQHIELANELREPAIVRAPLVHLDFVAVHPFPDGNGRIARFLMNLCLMTAGFPWVTIRSDDRIPYFETLEAATVRQDRDAIRELRARVCRSCGGFALTGGTSAPPCRTGGRFASPISVDRCSRFESRGLHRMQLDLDVHPGDRRRSLRGCPCWGCRWPTASDADSWPASPSAWRAARSRPWRSPDRVATCALFPARRSGTVSPLH